MIGTIYLTTLLSDSLVHYIKIDVLQKKKKKKKSANFCQPIGLA